MVRSGHVGGGGKQVCAESPKASRPGCVLSCSAPVLLVNSVSVSGRGGEAEHTLAGVNEKHKMSPGTI